MLLHTACHGHGTMCPGGGCVVGGEHFVDMSVKVGLDPGITDIRNNDIHDILSSYTFAPNGRCSFTLRDEMLK